MAAKKKKYAAGGTKAGGSKNTMGQKLADEKEATKKKAQKLADSYTKSLRKKVAKGRK